jgi:DNA polymerase-3 subunit epsilon
MKTLAIIDSETTGIDPAKDNVIEIGCVLYSIEHRSVISTWSDLVQHTSNEAEAINKIPPATLPLGLPFITAMEILHSFVARADAIVAHRAEFDSAFLPGLKKPWVCSKFDVEWPQSKVGDSLVFVALAHDVPVTGAHRALTDCLLLARIFENAAKNFGADIQALLVKAMRPKALFQAMTSYDEREMTKQAGFQWDPAAKRWTRKMAIADVEALPFKVRRID